MKTTENANIRESVELPAIYELIDKEHGQLLLLIHERYSDFDEGEGIKLKGSNNYPSYSDCWDLTTAKPYIGSLTIENQYIIE